MKKRPLHDVVTKPHRQRPAGSTRPPREEESTERHGERDAHAHQAHVPPRHTPPREPYPPLRDAASRSAARWFWIATAAAVIILAAVFGISLYFSAVTVTVVPREEQDVVVDGRFFARANEVPGELTYTTMEIERIASRDVTASERREVEEYASGEIIIFNDFDENPQRLIKNTRFEAPDGNIYRIRDSIVVPGQQVNDQGETVPGEVSATVYADEPGEEYNIGMTEFTIPGFEGGPRYEAFTAQSKTPIDGGFVGMRLSIPESQEEDIRVQLRDELRNELRTAALSDSEKPENAYLFSDALFFDFESLPSVEVDEEMLSIREKGVVNGVLFNKAEFARHIAANTIAGYDGNPVRLDSTEELTVSVGALDSEQAPSDEQMYQLDISGTAHIVWTYDEDQLRRDLAGRDESAINTVLSGYPGIEQIEVSWRPFWKFWQRSFPDDAQEIEITSALD